MNIFVLCAGDAERWGNHLGVPKQCIEFGGESLLRRMLRLSIAFRPSHTFCVSRLVDLVPDGTIPLLLQQTTCIADTIQQTSPYWGQHNVFLLGDVFYSPDSICSIIQNCGNLTFFGRPWGSQLVKCGHGELFGLVVREQADSELKSLLRMAVSACSDGHAGNLWNIHHLAAGIPLGQRNTSSMFIEVIDDYTNDIDTPVDYQRRRELYEHIAQNEVKVLPVL